MKRLDRIIIGGGLYGLYAALFCAKRNEKIIVLEYDDNPFGRATYINQARVHMGYHYPRSISTAMKSAHYFNRFVSDYGFCINNKFEQIYATSKHFSWTNADSFKKFCTDVNIRCEEIPVSKYFNDSMCDGAFLTEEYTYDANQLKNYYIDEIAKYRNVEIKYGVRIKSIEQLEDSYRIVTEDEVYCSDFVLNATYASVNQIINKIGKKGFDIKYELCEIILGKVSSNLEKVGLTVMDGPFFSIMPFGNTGFHSLTAVTFTPHLTSMSVLPDFDCQSAQGALCKGTMQLGNCNLCPERPDTAWEYMNKLAEKYLKKEFKMEYNHSLFSMKPILKAAEVDDSRPTVVQYISQHPTFVSVLSGKINTVYDLDEVLEEK